MGTAPCPSRHPLPGDPWPLHPHGLPTLTLFPLPGLKRIHLLTVQGSYELRIDLEDFDNGTAFAHYGSFGVGLFSVDPEEDGYPITIADYSGTAGRAAGWGGTRGPVGRGSPQPPNPLAGVLQCPLAAAPAAPLRPQGAAGTSRAVVGHLLEEPHWRSPTGIPREAPWGRDPAQGQQVPIRTPFPWDR